MRNEKTVHTPEYRQLLAKLIQARKKAGLTQRQLALALECHYSWIAKVEIGERRLDVIELIRLANSVGLDPAKLVRSLDAALKIRKK